MLGKIINTVIFCLFAFSVWAIIQPMDARSEDKAEETKEEPKKDIDYYLKGEHKLRQMHWEKVYISKEDEYSRTMLVFLWELPDKTYVYSMLPLEKIRIKINDSRIEPIIKFRWNPRTEDRVLEKMIANQVVYAVIECNSETCKAYYNLKTDCQKTETNDYGTTGTAIRRLELSPPTSK